MKGENCRSVYVFDKKNDGIAVIYFFVALDDEPLKMLLPSNSVTTANASLIVAFDDITATVTPIPITHGTTLSSFLVVTIVLS